MYQWPPQCTLDVFVKVAGGCLNKTPSQAQHWPELAETVHHEPGLWVLHNYGAYGPMKERGLSRGKRVRVICDEDAKVSFIQG